MNHQHRKARRPELYQPGQILRGPRKAALIAVSVLVSLMSMASFSESYRGLYEWASRHALSGIWAGAWPLMLDSFIAVGELALFVGLCDGWPKRSRIGAWFITALGLSVSVAGNIGHVESHSWTARGTGAIPPLAAAATLAVGLGILKRVVAAAAATRPPEASQNAAVGANVAHDVLTAARAAYLASVAGGNALSVRQLSDRFGLTRPQAAKVVASSNVDQQAIEAARP